MRFFGILIVFLMLSNLLIGQDWVYTIKGDSIKCEENSIKIENGEFKFLKYGGIEDSLSLMMVISCKFQEQEVDYSTPENYKLSELIQTSKKHSFDGVLDSLLQNKKFFVYTKQKELLIGDTLEWFMNTYNGKIPFSYREARKYVLYASFKNKARGRYPFYVKINDDYIGSEDIQLYFGALLPGNYQKYIYNVGVYNLGFDVDTVFGGRWGIDLTQYVLPESNSWGRNFINLYANSNTLLEKGNINIYGYFSPDLLKNKTYLILSYSKEFDYLKEFKVSRLRKDLILCSDCIEILDGIKVVWKEEKRQLEMLRAIRLYNSLFIR